MKTKLILTLITALPVAAIGCTEAPHDHLMSGSHGGMATGNDSLAAGENGTFEHMQQSMGSDNGYTDPVVKQLDDAQMGTADQVARLHGAQKVSFQELGTILAGLGVNTANKTVGSAGALYAAGMSALGAPVYTNRVPEQIIPSTSSLAKQFDIFSAAATEIIANIGNSKRCPGVVLVQANQLTADGISCLMGKAAHPEHVTLANQLVTQASTPQIGIQIAVATILSAAHTSE